MKKKEHRKSNKQKKEHGAIKHHKKHHHALQKHLDGIKNHMDGIEKHMMSYPTGKVAKKKEHKVMREFKEGALHSGSKKGPKVKNRKQAIAIALSEARRAKKK